ncbi:MAG: hypothetical protein EBZ50_05105, partial [Alphaproteobacteria bacterium]|nr:hypothetical protein [Alphaproteobacteria bacterium]
MAGFGMTEQMARALMRDRSGNVAMMWAVSALALSGLVGFSVDFGRAYTIREKLQNAADAAALAAERAKSKPEEERAALARRAFLSNLGQVEDPTKVNIKFTSGPNGSRVTATAPAPLMFAGIVGYNGQWTLSVTADADSGQPIPLEVALVLDNTGSMRNDMQALRDSSKDLANTLFDGSSDETVRVAVVPFVSAVNIGNSNDRMAWMDQTAANNYHGFFLENRTL